MPTGCKLKPGKKVGGASRDATKCRQCCDRALALQFFSSVGDGTHHHHVATARVAVCSGSAYVPVHVSPLRAPFVGRVLIRTGLQRGAQERPGISTVLGARQGSDSDRAASGLEAIWESFLMRLLRVKHDHIPPSPRSSACRPYIVLCLHSPCPRTCSPAGRPPKIDGFRCRFGFCSAQAMLHQASSPCTHVVLCGPLAVPGRSRLAAGPSLQTQAVDGVPVCSEGCERIGLVVQLHHAHMNITITPQHRICRARVHTFSLCPPLPVMYPQIHLRRVAFSCFLTPNPSMGTLIHTACMR